MILVHKPYDLLSFDPHLIVVYCRFMLCLKYVQYLMFCCFIFFTCLNFCSLTFDSVVSYFVVHYSVVLRFEASIGEMEQKPSALIIASVILSLVAKVCQEVLLSTVLQTRYFQAGFSNSGPQYRHSSKHSIPTRLKPVTQVVWTLGIFLRGSHILFLSCMVTFNFVVFLIVTAQPTFAWAKWLKNSKHIKRPITKKEEETMTVLL